LFSLENWKHTLGLGERREEEKEGEKGKIRQERSSLIVDFTKDSILRGM